MKMKIPCGRTKTDCYLCCLNKDHTWKSNRLTFEKFKVFKDTHNKLRINIHYEIYCKKCGHLKASGNHFGFNVIKQLITGKIYF